MVIVVVSIVREPARLHGNRPSHHDVTLTGLERNLHHSTLLQGRCNGQRRPDPVGAPLQSMTPKPCALGLLTRCGVEADSIILDPEAPLPARRRQTDGNRSGLRMSDGVVNRLQRLEPEVV